MELIKRELTLWEATSIIVGAGVGGGIMAVPYLTAQAGALAFWPIVLIALAANILLHLMLVEVLLRDGRDLQVVELIRTYVLRGRWGEIGIWLFFALLLVAFVANLTAYMAGAGEIVAELLPLPLTVARLLVYVVSALIVYLGLKVIGISEQAAVVGTGALVVVIVVSIAGRPFSPADALGNVATLAGLQPALALFGMVMYSLYAFFAVPQVVKGLRRDPQRIVRAVIIGLLLNALLIIFFVFVALAVAEPVTEVAIIGIGRAGTRFGAVAGSLFVLLAMVTSYWSVALALSDIIHERTAIDQRIAFAIATLPTLLLIVLGSLNFLDYLEIAGGVTGLIVVLITVPMYIQARRSGPVRTPAWALGRWAARPVLLLLLLATVVMALGLLLG